MVIRKIDIRTKILIYVGRECENEDDAVGSRPRRMSGGPAP